MQEEQQSYFSESPAMPAEAPQTDLVVEQDGGISWTASEFLDHHKSASWYGLFGGAVTLLAVLAFVITRDLFTPGAVVVLSSLFGFAANRRPRVLDYHIDASGIHVGSRHYPFENFQSFAVAQEGPVESIILSPAKRWAPPITMYFSPEDGQKIFDLLSDYIPLEDHKKDPIDKLLHKIRF